MGQQIFKGKRAPGQSNPSDRYIQAQSVAHQFWPIFRVWQDFVRQGWTLKATKESEANAFYRNTYDNAFDLSSPPTATLLPTSLLPAHGTMTPTILSATPTVVTGTQLVHLSWPTAVMDPTQNANDVLRVVLYDVTLNRAFTTNAGFLRSAGSGSASYPDNLIGVGDTVIVYWMFIASPTGANPGTSSDSLLQSVTAS